jgi:hypothetical protein
VIGGGPRWRRARQRPVLVIEHPAAAALTTALAASGAAAVSAAAQRDPVVAVAFARLEVAAQLRDPAAAARILDGLGHDPVGRWLLHQMASAGLRALAQVAAAGDPRGGEEHADSGGITEATEPVPRVPQPPPAPGLPPGLIAGPATVAVPAPRRPRPAAAATVWRVGGLALHLPPPAGDQEQDRNRYAIRSQADIARREAVADE